MAVTRGKKRLGKYLAELRIAAGQDLEKLAKELRTTRVSLGRYEDGQVLPPWATTQLLLQLLDASADQQAEASARWEVANDEPPSVRLPTGCAEGVSHVGQRRAALRRQSAIFPVVIPGLLQTEHYAWALLDAASPVSTRTMPRPSVW